MTRALPNQSVAKGVEYERIPKGKPISDSAREWSGWGTALKPACEPIILARKPFIGTVATNVLEHGTGAINVDACRIGADGGTTKSTTKSTTTSVGSYLNAKAGIPIDAGRWPANVIHDGSEEVLAAFPSETGVSQGGRASAVGHQGFRGDEKPIIEGVTPGYGDSGSAARYFYTAKADADDRLGSSHPTVKPVDLMQWLVRLVTRKDGLVLDPFAGTGTTGEACIREGMRAVLIEREERFVADIHRRMTLAMSGPDERARESIKEKIKQGRIKDDPGPLFA